MVQLQHRKILLLYARTVRFPTVANIAPMVEVKVVLLKKNPK